ncbi:MAG: Proline-rich receptor-like protein kinase [Nocardia sp.]|uniref:hypothetical protein n=1 Tax=Nocardia sp. TaxID=1821 RepID=UPI00262D5B9D|nr:hypothetical protein [Nocardia sp.]MCU1645311.1 Proline-rich receptor-like protein kinase [Nocardia sp.]
MTFDMSGKSIDDILDYGAPGLEYWERFLPLYDKAFTATHDVERSALQAAYDEQRGADLAKLDSARAELVQALDQSEAQWAAQYGAAQRLPSCWTSGAGGEALAMVVNQLRRAREDLDAARTAATAIGAAVEPLRQAVLTKAENVLALLEETPNGARKLAIAGKCPDDIDAMLGDHPDPWLTTTFKPDVEHKLAAFQATCAATNHCFETHYDTIVAALNQILDLPYPQPATIPIVVPAPEQSPDAAWGRNSEPAPADRGQQPPPAPETGWAQRPEPAPVQPHQSYPSVTSGGPQADSAPTAPASVESQPAQPRSLPDPSPDSRSAGGAQPRSVPNTPPAEVQSVPNVQPNGSAQPVPSATPDGANRTQSAPGAQSGGSSHLQSRPNSDPNGLTSLADLVRSLLSVLDPSKLSSLTDLLHPSDPSAHPDPAADPAPDSQHPGDHPSPTGKDGGAPAEQCPQPGANQPEQKHHPESNPDPAPATPSADEKSSPDRCPAPPAQHQPASSCDSPPQTAECPVPQRECRTGPDPSALSADGGPASCLIRGTPPPGTTQAPPDCNPPSPDDGPVQPNDPAHPPNPGRASPIECAIPPGADQVSPDQVRLTPHTDATPLVPPDQALPPDPPAPDGNSPPPRGNSDLSVEIPEGGVEIPELSDATPP